MFFPLLSIELFRLNVGGLKIPIFNLLVVAVLLLNIMRCRDKLRFKISGVEKNFITLFLFFVITCVSSLFLIEDVKSGIGYIVKLLFVLVFLFYLKSFDDLSVERLIRVIVVMSAVLMCGIIYKYLFVFDVSYISSTLSEASEVGKNQLSLYLTVTTPLALWLWVFEKKLVSVYTLCLGIHVAALFLVFSKASMIIIIVATFVMFCREMMGPRTILYRSNLFIVLMAVGVFVSACVVALLGHDDLRENFLENVNWFVGGTEESQSSMLRKYYISRALGFFYEHPIFGIGITNFSYLVGGATHNSYIQILAEVGLLGFVQFMALVILMLKYVFAYKPVTVVEVGVQQALLSAILYLLFINASNTLIVYMPFLFIIYKCGVRRNDYV
jgi:O-antigen ligase